MKIHMGKEDWEDDIFFKKVADYVTFLRYNVKLISVRFKIIINYK